MGTSTINGGKAVNISTNQELQSGSSLFHLNGSFPEMTTTDVSLQVTPISVTISGITYPLSVTNDTFTISDIPYRTVLVAPGQHSSKNYRIPGMATNLGTILAVHNIRYDHSGDLPRHIDVGLKRSTDNGRSWGKMEVIMDMDDTNEDVVKNTYGNGVGDPAILVNKTSNVVYVTSVWL